MTVYEELAARLYSPNSAIVIKILKILGDETDMQILLALPSDIPTLETKLNLSAEILEARLHELYLRGAVFFNKKRSPVTYRTVTEIIHLHDTATQWKQAPQEFLDLWQQWIETELVETSIKTAEMHKRHRPAGRIIAADIWVEPRTEVLALDSIKEIISNAKSLAVLPCTCRMKAKKCDHPIDVCIVLNKSADYNIERGTGKKIDAQEALEIFKKCEEEGLVHMTGANAQDDPGPLICNCCPCCCMGIYLTKNGFAFNDPSRFRAEIDREKCSGCGICHTRCYFDAIGWEDGEGSIAVINAEKCLGCGLCRAKCPSEAITLIEARSKDFIPQSGGSLYG